MNKPAIRVIHNEAKRGCGFRSPGGLYLVTDGLGASCGRLPAPIHVCPTCGHGLKPSRGYAWISPRPFVEALPPCRASHCPSCPLGGAVPERAGLLWIGGKYYSTPEDWSNEARLLGVSRRLAQLPNDFVIGETWVFVAHREATTTTCPECRGKGKVAIANVAEAGSMPHGTTVEVSGVKCTACAGKGRQGSPAVFHAFRPQRVEYVVTKAEAAAVAAKKPTKAQGALLKRLARLEKRGVSLVDVQRDAGSGENNA